jgi:hypothetical protein
MALVPFRVSGAAADQDAETRLLQVSPGRATKMPVATNGIHVMSVVLLLAGGWVQLVHCPAAAAQRQPVPPHEHTRGEQTGG